MGGRKTASRDGGAVFYFLTLLFENIHLLRESFCFGTCFAENKPNVSLRKVGHMSRILKTVTTLAVTSLLSSVAYAGCNSGTYCNSGSNLAPLSSWSGSSTGSSFSTPSFSSAPSYSSSTSYSSGSSFGGVMSSGLADATSGTGSISSAYEGGDVELFGFSGSTTSVPGLGFNESLQSTNCPVNVFNPTGARVLGCYNVVKQVPQTNYVRVVRPVIYVRYPVATPIPVPYYVNNACGAQNVVYSRYVNQPRRNSCGNGW